MISQTSMTRNMKQFHLYALRTLHFAALAAHSERMRRAKKEIVFSDLSSHEANKIYAIESSFYKDTVFGVLGNAGDAKWG